MGGTNTEEARLRDGFSSSVFAYSLSAVNFWRSHLVASLRMPRFNHASCSHASLLYAIGGDEISELSGEEINLVSTSKCERYDPVTNKWTKIVSIKTARKESVPVSFGDCVWVLSGYNCFKVSDAFKKERSNFQNWIELYHPVEDWWTDLVVPMLTSRCNHQAIAVDGRIFMFGGESDGLTLKSSEFYDLKSDHFTYIGTMTIVRQSFGVGVARQQINSFGGFQSRSVA